jgi:tRNA1(Val) A37 N6-methylase TrmN6
VSGATVDAFHRGKFVIVQPGKEGHRSGVDAMILAAAVSAGFDGAAADFGAGAGAAGMAAAARCPNALVTLVEIDPVMADFARRTIGHEANAVFSSRLSLLQADVSLSGKSRVNSGLCDRSFDFVIMNPPFNSPRDRATPDALKAAAHVMADGMFEAWLRTAAAVLRPGGWVAIMARPASLKEILDASEGRFGGLRIMPILPRPSGAAIRILVSGIKGSRAGLSLEPPLVLHGESGNGFSARAEAVINGEEWVFRPSSARFAVSDSSDAATPTPAPPHKGEGKRRARRVPLPLVGRG